MPAIVQIVSAVGAAGTVLLDLNRAPLGQGVYLGPRGDVALADLELAESQGDRAFAWSPMPVEPAAVRARQVTVPVVLVGSSADDVAAKARSLQQLTRSRFVLKLQRHGASAPVWLRCAPCAPQLSSNVAAAGQPTTIVTGSLTAQTEPYAVGARVDVGPVTITQDPASGTPFVWDINSVGGDSLTPLVLRTADADIRGQVDRILISTRRRGTPSGLAGLVVQAEAGTTSTGTTPPTLSTVTGDATLSGSSGVRATYGTGASGRWSVTATFTGLTGAEAAGTYRLLARCRRGGAAAGQLFSLVATAGPTRLVETFTASGNDLRIIDLGLVQVPYGQPPYLAAPESPVSAAAPTVTVTVVRAAEGTGTFDLDWLALIPADQDCGALEVSTTAGSGVLVLDGYDQQPRLYTTDPYTGVTPAAAGATGLTWTGGAPRLAPGSNRLYVVGGLGTAASSARTPALQLDVSASYWPRTGWLA